MFIITIHCLHYSSKCYFVHGLCHKPHSTAVATLSLTFGTHINMRPGTAVIEMTYVDACDPQETDYEVVELYIPASLYLPIEKTYM